jgi:hypothetical protein
LSEARDFIDIDRYPIDREESAEYSGLVLDCKTQLRDQGSFNLEGFLRPGAIDRAVHELEPLVASGGFRHARRHNIYFKDDIPGLPGEHPAAGNG